MGPLDKYVLSENSLKATETGFELSFQSHWYRSLSLSCMDFTLKIEGEQIEKTMLKIRANDKEFSYEQLKELDNEWLFVLDKGILRVQKPIEQYKSYHVELRYDLNIPYILVGPESKPLLASTIVKKILICQ
jgi:Domain of unknown function (DUF6379)